MPSLSEHQSQSALKLLLIGNSGSGKSGALAPLAAVGYKLRILDVDNGLDVLYNIIKQHKPEALSNVVFETITNKVKGANGKVLPVGSPDAFPRALNLLTHWKVGKDEVRDPKGTVISPRSADFYDLGPISNWGSDTILVIDSLTFLSQMALSYVLFLQGRIGQQAQIQDWGEAMRYIEDMLGLLYSDAIKCNVIINSHIVPIEMGDGSIQSFPTALGNKLPPKVGRYFNTMLMCKSKGFGATKKQVIVTQSIPGLELKNPNPGIIPPEIEFSGITGGLATFFELLLGAPPAKKQAATTQPTTNPK